MQNTDWNDTISTDIISLVNKTCIKIDWNQNIQKDDLIYIKANNCKVAPKCGVHAFIKM